MEFNYILRMSTRNNQRSFSSYSVLLHSSVWYQRHNVMVIMPFWHLLPGL